MKNKNEGLWVTFVSLGTMFFVISITINISWLKLTLIAIAMIEYIVAIIFAAKHYADKKRKNETCSPVLPPPPQPQTLKFKR